MSIKAIVFDFGGILMAIDYHATSRAFKELGAENFDFIFKQSHQVEIFDLFERGLITPEVFRRDLAKLLNISRTDAEFDAAWNGMVFDMLPGRLPFIQQLKERGYKIFLYSNTNAIHLDNVFEKVEREFFEAHFDKAYYSHIVQKNKPHPTAFMTVAKDIFKNHQVAPHELLFFDDTIRHVDGAKQAGWNAQYLPANLDEKAFISQVLEAIEAC